MHIQNECFWNEARNWRVLCFHWQKMKFTMDCLRKIWFDFLENEDNQRIQVNHDFFLWWRIRMIFFCWLGIVWKLQNAQILNFNSKSLSQHVFRYDKALCNSYSNLNAKIKNFLKFWRTNWNRKFTKNSESLNFRKTF